MTTTQFPSPGVIHFTNAQGGVTKLFFTNSGLIQKAQDPLGQELLFEYADGTSLTNAQIALLPIPQNGTAGDDNLYGSDGRDSIDGLAGNDYIDAGTGTNTITGGKGNDSINSSSGSNDTYLFNLGDGADSISTYEASGTPNDILQFDPGVSAGNITIERKAYDLIFKVGTNGDQVSINQWFYGINHQLAALRFVDGSFISNDQVGTPYITLEAQGNTKLLRRFDGAAFAQLGVNSPIQITSPWGSGAGTDSSEWQMIAAETIGGVNRLLWRNNTANFLHTWSLDSDWNLTAASGADGFNTAAAWALESSFQVDGNRDGIIGAPL